MNMRTGNTATKTGYAGNTAMAGAGAVKVRYKKPQSKRSVRKTSTTPLHLVNPVEVKADLNLKMAHTILRVQTQTDRKKGGLSLAPQYLEKDALYGHISTMRCFHLPESDKKRLPEAGKHVSCRVDRAVISSNKNGKGAVYVNIDVTLMP